MNYFTTIFTIGFLSLSINFYGQAINSDTNNPGWKYANDELNLALSNTESHNIINNKTVIITDSITAIKIAEPILFGIYGEENIINQKPYSVFHITNYWIISGRLPQSNLENDELTIVSGGTFLIIINDINCEILKITHSK